METTWSSVFCSKFNWKSHSCTTKQWKKLAAWKHLQAYIMSILYIKSKKMIPPSPKFTENVWWPLVSKILASSNSSSSSSLSWHKRGGDVFLCGKKTWQMNPPQYFANDLNEDSQTPNKILTLHHICVFKKHSNLHKLEKRLKVGWIWDFPTGFKMPKILPGHTRTVWGENSQVRELFGSPQSMEKFYRSLVGFWLSVFQRNLSKWCPIWLHQMPKFVAIPESCLMLEVFGDWIGFTNLMISCHWISNLERNKMCVCGGLVGREGLQYP